MDLLGFRELVRSTVAAAVDVTVHGYLPDAPHLPCVYLGRPTVSGTPTLITGEVSIPVVIVADGTTRGAEQRLDALTMAAWDALVAAGCRPDTATPITVAFTDDGPDRPAVQLTVTGYA